MQNAPSGKKHIVLIDDHKDVLKICSLVLTKIGHYCTTYSNSGEALSDLKTGQFELDLIITDYSMPGVSGIDIADYCRVAYPELPVILATGYGDDITDKVVQDNAPVKAIIRKPFDLQAFRTTVSEALSI